MRSTALRQKSAVERQFENAVVAGARALELDGMGVLCAVSGGPDSVALVLALSRRLAVTGIGKLAIAHVDHQLRKASKADARVVRKLSTSLDLPYFEATVTVEVKGAGLEAGARAARYLALAEMARAGGYDVVATGHTQTDQAETVLLRLLRGSGLRGLSAMAPLRRLGAGITLARPMLGLSGRDTRAYIQATAAAICEDESNLDLTLRRNALRLSVWPALVQLEPTLETRLAELAAQVREDEDALEALARTAAMGLVERSGAGLAIAIRPLLALPPAVSRRMMRRVILGLRPASQPTAVHLKALLALATKGHGQVHVAGDLSARASSGQLWLGPRPKKE